MTAIESSTAAQVVPLRGLENVPEIGFVAFKQKADAVQQQYSRLSKQLSIDPNDATKFTKKCTQLVEQADSFKELLEVTNSVGSYNMRVQTLFYEYQKQLDGEKSNLASQLSTTYRTICWKFI